MDIKNKNLNPKKIILILIFFSAFSLAMAQKELKITPYTIESTFQKLKKDYPFVVPITPLVSDEIIREENIVYKEVDGQKLKADIYYPSGKQIKTYPAILLIHGGGWISGSKENERIMAQHLAKNGYVAITAAYRLSREAPYPAAVLDLKHAIRWMRINAKKYSINPDKMAVLGASAGAQLATLIGVTPNNKLYKDANSTVSDAVQAIINVDGIVSFIHPDSEESEIAGKWLGGLEHENPKNWKEASPLEYVNENTPPTLFVNSSKPRFHAGRDDMLAILNENNTYNEVHTLDDSPHSFWLMHPWFEDTLNYILVFLDKTMKNK